MISMRYTCKNKSEVKNQRKGKDWSSNGDKYKNVCDINIKISV